MIIKGARHVLSGISGSTGAGSDHDYGRSKIYNAADDPVDERPARAFGGTFNHLIQIIDLEHTATDHPADRPSREHGR